METESPLVGARFGYHPPMLDIAVVAILLVVIWTLVLIVAGRSRSWAWRLAIVVAGAGLTLLSGKGLLELMSARTFQVFGRIVSRVETSEPVIALTFDDGPSSEYTGPVLELLRERNVKATFFVTGAESSENREYLARIIADGHEIGNHSWSHPRMILLSRARIEAEIEPTDDVIREAGYAGPIHFRSPFGKKFFSLPLYLKETGRTNIFWDLEPDSHADVAATPAGIAQHVRAGARPGSIVLLHVMYSSRETSRAALPILIDDLRARGFRFVTVSELLELQSPSKS